MDFVDTRCLVLLPFYLATWYLERYGAMVKRLPSMISYDRQQAPQPHKHMSDSLTFCVSLRDVGFVQQMLPDTALPPGPHRRNDCP